MKLKQNSFKTVLKLFCFSLISLCGQFKYAYKFAAWHYAQIYDVAGLHPAFYVTGHSTEPVVVAVAIL